MTEELRVINAVDRFSDPTKNFTEVERTGVGYGGLKGVTWNMTGRGERSIPIPKFVFDRLQDVMSAVVAYTRTLQHLTDNAQVAALLGHKRPGDIKPSYGTSTLRLFRPDIVLFRGSDGEINFKITEIESAPGGLGLFEGVRLAYEWSPRHKTILQSLRELVGDREFIVVMTHGWIDYIWDVCVAVKWLRDHGVNARVIIDRSLEDVESFASHLWKKRQQEMPSFTSQLPNWDPRLLQRLRHYGFYEFVEWHAELPEVVTDRSVVFRMGYHGSFRDRDTISKLLKWERKNKATILNGINPGLENKAMIAALGLTEVRAALKPSIKRNVLQLLDDHFARTQVVDPTFSDLNHICQMHKNRILKVAAWDKEDRLSWGARGITDGDECTNREWVQAIGQALAAPHPVVVQERVESIRRNYRDTIGVSGEGRDLKRARQRWTPFVLVDDQGKVQIDPGMITALDSFAAHGAVGAVMVPVEIVD